MGGARAHIKVDLVTVLTAVDEILLGDVGVSTLHTVQARKHDRIRKSENSKIRKFEVSSASHEWHHTSGMSGQSSIPRESFEGTPISGRQGRRPRRALALLTARFTARTGRGAEHGEPPRPVRICNRGQNQGQHARTVSSVVDVDVTAILHAVGHEMLATRRCRQVAWLFRQPLEPSHERGGVLARQVGVFARALEVAAPTRLARKVLGPGRGGMKG